MPASKEIILRFESKNGQFRLSVDDLEYFTSMLPGVSFLYHLKWLLHDI